MTQPKRYKLAKHIDSPEGFCRKGTVGKYSNGVYSFYYTNNERSYATTEEFIKDDRNGFFELIPEEIKQPEEIIEVVHLQYAYRKTQPDIWFYEIGVTKMIKDQDLLTIAQKFEAALNDDDAGEGFVWDDKLVEEILQDLYWKIKNNELLTLIAPGFIHTFKQSKQRPSSRPPLGVMPEWRWKELRLQELNEATERYKDAFKEIPDEWIEEKYQLQTWLNKRKNGNKDVPSSDNVDTKSSVGDENNVRNTSTNEGKDWEIVTIYSNKSPRAIEGKEKPSILVVKESFPNGKYGYTGETIEKYLAPDSSWSIHSVKRLSDGEVFTVGDECTYNEKEYWLISGFDIYNDKIGVLAEVTLNDGRKDDRWRKCFLKSAKKKLPSQSSKPEPLFRTEDGKDIFEGDAYWWVCTLKNKDENVICCDSEWQQGEGKASDRSCTDKNYALFSTQEAANEYVLMNKPCLSVNEVVEITRRYWGLKVAVESDLQTLAQSKTNKP